MRRWIFPIILIFSLILPVTVSAQAPLTFDSVVTQIWPEYDKPGVLVIYQMTLPATTAFPASLSMRIPTAAGEPNAVAIRQVDGNLFSTDYTRQVDGDWATISFITPSPEVQLEYYDPSLEIDGDARHYQYTWPADYTVSQFTMEVQQPAGATDMRISPSLGTGITRGDNLTYFSQDIGSIPAGQNINLSIDYNKTTDTLSAETLPVEPSAPIPQSSATDINISAWLPWILGILGAGLIIGGIIWFWQSGKQHASTRTHRSRSRAAASETSKNGNTAEETIYCSQCGKRASPGDQFCRSCGTAIRGK